jgi:hypothetical protein
MVAQNREQLGGLAQHQIDIDLWTAPGWSL